MTIEGYDIKKDMELAGYVPEPRKPKADLYDYLRSRRTERRAFTQEEKMAYAIAQKRMKAFQADPANRDILMSDESGQWREAIKRQAAEEARQFYLKRGVQYRGI